MSCPWCSKEFSGRSLASHMKWCKNGPHREDSLKQNRESNGFNAEVDISCQYCGKVFHHGYSLGGHVVTCSSNPNRLERIGNLGKIHSEETKRKISLARSKAIARDPEGQRLIHRGPSNPEKYLAVLLKEWGFKFKTQYNDIFLWNKGYRADFYLWDYHCVLEVNGAFKYTSGKFAQYYVDRQRVIEDSGYLVVNIYYSDVYKMTKEKLLALVAERIRHRSSKSIHVGSNPTQSSI